MKTVDHNGCLFALVSLLVLCAMSAIAQDDPKRAMLVNVCLIEGGIITDNEILADLAVPA